MYRSIDLRLLFNRLRLAALFMCIITLNACAILKGVQIPRAPEIKTEEQKAPPEKIEQILQAKDRRTAGPIAPPEGLCLMWIKY